MAFDVALRNGGGGFNISLVSGPTYTETPGFSASAALTSTDTLTIIVDEPINTDPTTGTKSGDTIFVDAGGGDGYLRLIEAASFARGQFHYSGDIEGDFYVRWDYWAGGGSGGEAVWLFWGAIAVPVQEDTDEDQYAVVINAWTNNVELRFAGAVVTSVAFADIDNSTWRTVEVTQSGTNIVVLIDSVEILDYTDTTRTMGGTSFGWGARNGGANNEWRIRELYLESPAPPTSGPTYTETPAFAVSAEHGVSDRQDYVEAQPLAASGDLSVADAQSYVEGTAAAADVEFSASSFLSGAEAPAFMASASLTSTDERGFPLESSSFAGSAELSAAARQDHVELPAILFGAGFNIIDSLAFVEPVSVSATAVLSADDAQGWVEPTLEFTLDTEMAAEALLSAVESLSLTASAGLTVDVVYTIPADLLMGVTASLSCVDQQHYVDAPALDVAATLGILLGVEDAPSFSVVGSLSQVEVQSYVETLTSDIEITATIADAQGRFDDPAFALTAALSTTDIQDYWSPVGMVASAGLTVVDVLAGIESLPLSAVVSFTAADVAASTEDVAFTATAGVGITDIGNSDEYVEITVSAGMGVVDAQSGSNDALMFVHASMTATDVQGYVEPLALEVSADLAAASGQTFEDSASLGVSAGLVVLDVQGYVMAAEFSAGAELTEVSERSLPEEVLSFTLTSELSVVTASAASEDLAFVVAVGLSVVEALVLIEQLAISVGAALTSADSQTHRELVAATVTTSMSVADEQHYVDAPNMGAGLVASVADRADSVAAPAFSAAATLSASSALGTFDQAAMSGSAEMSCVDTQSYIDVPAFVGGAEFTQEHFLFQREITEMIAAIELMLETGGSNIEVLSLEVLVALAVRLGAPTAVVGRFEQAAALVGALADGSSVTAWADGSPRVGWVDASPVVGALQSEQAIVSVEADE